MFNCEYKVGFKIAGRGNSKCYLATKDQKNYVLKSIEILKTDDEKRKKIENEIEALKKMNHENLIGYVDSFVCELGNREIHCIVTDFMKMNLAQYVQSKKKLKEKACKKIMKQIFRGVEYMHQNLIVHHDIKLENVCIDENNKIKIIDFGMSYIAKNEDKIQTMKKVVGTPFYVSPEKFSFLKYDGRKSDLWSCGVLLYRLLTNEFPFDPHTNQLSDLSDMIIEEDFVMPEGISEELEDLLKHLLCKDPSERYTATQALQHPWFNSLNSNKKLCKSAMLFLTTSGTLNKNSDITRSSVQLFL